MSAQLTAEPRLAPQPAPALPRFQPARVVQVELGAPLPPIAAAAGGRCYGRAVVLARLFDRPIGVAPVTLGTAGLAPDELAEQLWAVLAGAVDAALVDEGLAPAGRLSSAGLPPTTTPRSVRERARVLAAAPFATVVVATRDRPEVLGRSLDALLAQDYPRFEVVVVDNAPRDEATLELVRARYGGEGRVRYVREPRPGLSWARNRGLAEARGELVAFTDDDVTVDRGWLAALAAGFTRADDVACVTGLTLPAELETPAQVWFEQFGGFSRGFTPRVFDRREHRPTAWPAALLFPYAAGSFGSGNSMAFRAAFLREIGGFDPALSVGTPTEGGEDLAIFVQVIAAGRRLVYEPAALNFHSHRREYEALRRQMYGYGVGLTAALTALVVAQPFRLLDIAWRMPAAALYLFAPRAGKNAGKGRDYPVDLTRAERLGMLAGPVAYLRSRARTRAIVREHGPLEPAWSDAPPDFQPIRVLEVELSRPLQAIPALDPGNGRRYASVYAVVRLRSRPVGAVTLPLGEDGLPAERCAALIWQALSGAIAEQLRAAGEPVPATLDVGGLAGGGSDVVSPPHDAPLFSVVVPTRNRPEMLGRSLDALLAQDYPRFEVVVVDNAPRDEATLELVRARYGGEGRVRYVREPRPGLSWARNCGLAEARGELVAFTDDDVTVDRGWLAALAAGFTRADDVACVTGLTLPAELETPAQVWFEQFGGFSRGFTPRVFDGKEHRPTAWPTRFFYPYVGIFGAGNNMAFRAAFLREIGGFALSLGGGSHAMTGEDLAAMFLVITRGRRLAYEPAAIVNHFHRRDVEGLRQQMYGYGVGLSAFLLWCVAHDPRHLPALAARFPYALLLVLKRRKPERHAHVRYPPELDRLVRQGMLAGPAAFLRSWFASRGVRL